MADFFGRYPITGGSGAGALIFADSIVNNAGTVTLVNDSATPGSSKYYGTNGSGTLSYYSLPTVTAGNLTDAGTDGITITDGTGAVIGSGTSIAQHVADSTHNGYLSSTDWSTFNGTVPISRGGTNITTYTSGDILYSSATNVLSKLAKGTDGQFLKLASGLPSWSAGSSSSTFSYVAKTHADSPYTVLSTDATIVWTLTNGSNDSLVFPLAASNTGLVITVKLAANTAGFNKLSFTRTSTDTFILPDGTSVTTFFAQTTGETWTLQSTGGTTWQVIGHRADTGWSSSYTFTPNATSFGTITGSDFFSRRVADSLEVRGYFAAGTVTSNQAVIALPVGLSVSSTKYSAAYGSQQCGNFVNSGATTATYGSNNKLGVIQTKASDDSVYLSQGGGATASIMNITNADAFANSSGFSVYFTVPIDGWFS